MKKQLLLFVLTLLPLAANADESGTCGDNLIWTYYESTHSLVITGSGDMYNYPYIWDNGYNVPNFPWYKYHNDLVSVTLPKGLTSISKGAFFGCSSLTSVTIPNSVASIGELAFYICSGLTSVIIPNSVTSIGNFAFYKCSSLTSVNIPNSVTSLGEGVFKYCSGLTSVSIPNSVTSIGEQAFSECSDLTSVTIPNSVTSIGGQTFRKCSSLTSVTIPNSVTSIGNDAFSECYSLISVIIGNSVASIGEYAFYSCFGLTSVTIPNSVTFIGNRAFQSCSSLISVNIGNSVTSIGEYAFSGCRSLTSVTIPNSVTSIGEYAFEYCGSLNSVSLPDNLMMIKKQTFRNCSKLQKLDIPVSVEYIYQEAFNGCNSLKEIIARPETPPFVYNNTFSNYNCTLKVPDASKDAYVAHEIWSKFGTIQTISGEDIEKKQCATPTISYVTGKLTFDCETEGVEYQSTITDSDINSYTTAEIQLTAAYKITVYATKDGYENSERATATLCWIDQQPQTEGITNGVAYVPAQAVLIQEDGGMLTVQGADDGTQVGVYTVNGTYAGSAVCQNGTAHVATSLQPGSIAIVKVGKKSVKIIMK